MVIAGLSAFPKNNLFANSLQSKKVRMGIIGVGLRGQSHLNLALKRDDVDIVAICDIDDEMLRRSKALIAKAGKRMPDIFSGDDNAWRKMTDRKYLDAILIATPWEWHKPMIIGAVESGIKYVSTEVVLGITLEDHWDVVKTAEKHQAHVMMLENVCYRRDVMAILNMVRQGIFGELIHLQGGYQHDLREVKFSGGPSGGAGAEFGEKGFSEARWRTNHSVYRNGDLYPTHGVGPLAHYSNVNRGNRFISLCSFATKSRGLHNYVVKQGGTNHANASINFKLADVVTTTLQCANGETFFLQHDTNLPRPYSLGFRVQGTNGLWMDVNKGIYVEGKSQKAHQWDDQNEWMDKYDHPLWKRFSNDAQGAGHGGMDFFVLNAFIEAAKRGAPTPMDVYDAATWSAISPLSERSIELGNQTVEFPDFTGGKWMARKPIFALNDEY